jgi:hypothetical protein
MDLDAARQAAGLQPLPNPAAKPAEEKPEHGHGRGTTHDDRRLHDKSLRGIPLIGTGPGAIDGTKPGDSAQALEQAGRDILHAHLHRNRYHKDTTHDRRL